MPCFCYGFYLSIFWWLEEVGGWDWDWRRGYWGFWPLFGSTIVWGLFLVPEEDRRGFTVGVSSGFSFDDGNVLKD